MGTFFGSYVFLIAVVKKMLSRCKWPSTDAWVEKGQCYHFAVGWKSLGKLWRRWRWRRSTIHHLKEGTVPPIIARWTSFTVSNGFPFQEGCCTEWPGWVIVCIQPEVTLGFLPLKYSCEEIFWNPWWRGKPPVVDTAPPGRPYIGTAANLNLFGAAITRNGKKSSSPLV